MKIASIETILDQSGIALEGENFAISFAELKVKVEQFVGYVSSIREHGIVMSSSSPLAILTASLGCFLAGKIFIPINPKLAPRESNELLAQLSCSYICMEGHEWEGHDRCVLSYPSSIDSPWLVIFTSGTSGRPKGIVHSYGSIMESAASANKFFKLSQANRWLLSLGMYHIGGFMIAMRSLLANATICVPQEKTSLSQALDIFPLDFISLVPTQLQDLLAAGDFDRLSRLKAIVVGGASCPQWLLEKSRDFGLKISLCYGSSESGAMILATSPENIPMDSSIVGWPLPYREIKMEGPKLRIGNFGCFLGVMSLGQYHERKKDFYPQDEFTKLEDGSYKLLGRSDLVFQCGGENVSPSQMAIQLEASGLRATYHIIPKEDDRLGQVPILVVVTDQNIDLDGFLQFISSTFSPLFRPREIYVANHHLLESKPSRAKLSDLIHKGHLKQLWKYKKPS